MSIQTMHPKLQRAIREMELELIVGILANLAILLTIFEGIKIAQLLDPELVKIMDDILEGKQSTFLLFGFEILHLDGRLCIYQTTKG